MQACETTRFAEVKRVIEYLVAEAPEEPLASLSLRHFTIEAVCL